MDEIEKLKYHIRLLSEAMNAKENPIASLIISYDWSESDLDAAHDIFEKFDRRLKENLNIDWYDFENDFKIRFKIGYQDLKSIIISFFRSEQWTAVCREYARSHPCIEFTEIYGDSMHSIEKGLEERVARILISSNFPYSRNERIIANEKRWLEIDFLVQFPRARVAIEVKRTLNAHAYSHVERLGDAVRSSRIADEVWLVIEVVPRDIPTISSGMNIKILTVEQFERTLQEAR